MVSDLNISYDNTIKVLYTSARYQWQNVFDNNTLRTAVIDATIAYIIFMWVSAFIYIPYIGVFYMVSYVYLFIITAGLLAIIMAIWFYMEDSAFFIFLIGFVCFLFSYYWLSIILVAGATYIIYHLVLTRRWKKIYQMLEKSPEQLAKIDKKPKKDEPRVEITFRGADE